MKNHRLQSLAAGLMSLVAASVFFVGCGGSSNELGGDGRASVYFTDDLSNHDAVWVTVKKVELATPSGGSVTIFEDAGGRQVDLRSLRDNQGNLFLLIGSRPVPVGAYVGIEVTLDKNLVLFNAGSPNGMAMTFADALDDSNGDTKLEVNFPSPRNIGAGTTPLVFEFDLANWTVNGSVVTPVVKEGPSTGLTNPNRHISYEYRGVISGLTGTAPDQTFTITGPFGSVLVRTNQATAIFNSDGTANPTLANGILVQAKGQYNPGLNQLTAREVKIKKGDDGDDAEARGIPSAINAGALSFDVKVVSVIGFLPTSETIMVQANAQTFYRNSRGVVIPAEEFFTLLATAVAVEVEGAYNAGSNTMNLKKAKIQDNLGVGQGDGGQAEAKGLVTSANASGNTITISLQEWQGFNGQSGTAFTIETQGNTEFLDDDNNVLTKDEFYTMISGGGVVIDGKGSFSAGKIRATRARIKN